MSREHGSELGEAGQVLRSRLRLQAFLIDKALQSFIGILLLLVGTYLSLVWLGQLMSFTTYWVSLASIGGALAVALYNVNRGLPRLQAALEETSVAIKLFHGEYREQLFAPQTRIIANLLQVTMDESSIVRMAALLGLELDRFVVVPQRRLLWIPVLAGGTLVCLATVIVELVSGHGFPPGVAFLPVVAGVLLYLFLDWIITRLMRVVTVLRHVMGRLED